jgi:hypothetical protein
MNEAKPKKVRLRDQARTLRFFRLIRGPGGGMNDFGDRLEVLLRADSHADVVEIFATLGVQSTPQPPTPSGNPFQSIVFAETDPSDGSFRETSPSGLVMIDGVPVTPLLKGFELILSITDKDLPYTVTPAAIEAARAVEARIDLLAERVIDPRVPKRKGKRIRNPATQRLWSGITLLLIALIYWGLLADSLPGPTGATVRGITLKDFAIAALLASGLIQLIRAWRIIFSCQPKVDTTTPEPAPDQPPPLPDRDEFRPPVVTVAITDLAPVQTAQNTKNSNTDATPKERSALILLALLMAGLATLFALWAHDNTVAHARYSQRYGDFDAWVQSPGSFNFLRLRKTSSDRNIGFSVDCEYRFEVAGKQYVGSDFSLQFTTPTMGEAVAKSRVESVLGIAGKSQWRPIRYPHVGWHLDESTLDGWELATEGLIISVRHSSSDPSAASLTDMPPLPPWVDWILIVIQSLLAVAAATACVFMTLASIPPSSKPPPA